MIRFSCYFLLIFCTLKLSAQQSGFLSESTGNEISSNIENEQIDFLYKLYNSRIDPSFELINGRGYFPYYYRSQLKPVLFLEKTHQSSVTINGRRFENVTLDYDTFTDEIIYIDSSRICIFAPLRVAINKDNVDRAEFYDGIDSISLRYFTKETVPLFNLKEGYYEVVSESKSKYLIKHSSILKKIPGIDEYIYTTTGYADTGSGYIKITKRKNFIMMFGNRGNEVRKYMESMGIKFKKMSKPEIMNVLNYYDSLENRDK